MLYSCTDVPQTKWDISTLQKYPRSETLIKKQGKKKPCIALLQLLSFPSAFLHHLLCRSKVFLLTAGKHGHGQSRNPFKTTDK